MTIVSQTKCWHKTIIPNEVSLDSIEQTKFTEEFNRSFENFEFENESLRAAFSALPQKKKEVLRLLFIERLDSEEAAAHRK